jgi:pyruvate dehydrogenase E2 component (dihydrolipoamide acetyltransferase)
MNNGAHQAKASPLARRIADAKGIDLRGVNGSGPGGKIVKADLGLPDAALAQSVPAATPPIPTYGPPAGVPHDVIALSGMRKTIARRLAEAKQTVPHFYLTVDCNLDALLELRAKLNAILADSGVKLSVNDFLIKALALALTEVPGANVQFAGDRMYRFGRVDVSMAVAIDGGLITPVIADAANKRLSTIAKEAKELAALARDGKLKPEQYQGGTVSISNLGMFGIKEMVPVINPPQGMILGIGAGERRPYVVNDELAVATVLSATGSFDHRAIDGGVGAELMRAFRSLVERPMAMLA